VAGAPGRFTRHGKPLAVSEIIDLKISVQTMIFYEACEGHAKLIFGSVQTLLPIAVGDRVNRSI
jgi:hypothetical protein